MDTTDFFAGAAKRGDGEGLTPLYERLAPALYAWARIRLRTINGIVSPEDVLQEIWLRAIESFGRFENRGPGSFRAWIFQIASHVYIEIMRKRPSGSGSGAFMSQVPAEVTSITAGLRKNESIDRLVISINGLDADDRQLFMNHGLEGMTASMTATLLNISEDAVHKRWQRLRTKLSSMTALAELIED